MAEFVCYQNTNRCQDNRCHFAIVIEPGNLLQRGKMMAITIRDTQEHTEMLSQLKEQTGTSTMSKALLEGGYDALKYKELYLAERRKNEQLRGELYRHTEAINDYVGALDSLRELTR